MERFEPLDSNVEVIGDATLAIVNSFPEFMRGLALQMLRKHGIADPTPGQWYEQRALLKCFEDLGREYGCHTLFEVGKAIPDHAIFPPDVNNLEQALNTLDVAYQMNHRNGTIGFYKLTEHDKEKRRIIMQCRNPYPCDFDRGIITSLARKYYPNVNVTLDETKPSRKDGAKESWYIVEY